MGARLEKQPEWCLLLPLWPCHLQVPHVRDMSSNKELSKKHYQKYLYFWQQIPKALLSQPEIAADTRGIRSSLLMQCLGICSVLSLAIPGKRVLHSGIVAVRFWGKKKPPEIHCRRSHFLWIGQHASCHREQQLHIAILFSHQLPKSVALYSFESKMISALSQHTLL